MAISRYGAGRILGGVVIFYSVIFALCSPSVFSRSGGDQRYASYGGLVGICVGVISIWLASHMERRSNANNLKGAKSPPVRNDNEDKAK